MADDVVGDTGTIKKVPGYGAGTELKYRVGAVPTGKRTAHFWLQIKNPNAFDVDIIVCAMLNLDRPMVPDTDYSIEKVNGNWKCEVVMPDPGDGPDSYHFGCERMTIPAGGQKDAFDTVATFDSDVKNAMGDSLLETVYFDLLKDCPIEDCDIDGARNFLTPETPTGHADWANVWACNSSYTDLTDTGLSEVEWPSGNWVTMRKQETQGFPSRVQGTLSGAPAGAQFELILDGVLAHTAMVAPDPANPPCGGLDLTIDVPFITPPGSHAKDGIRVTLPNNPCGFLPEGTLARFNADIIADPGSPVYAPGDFMHGIDIALVHDTVPPNLVGANVQSVGNDIFIDVQATDDTTMVVGAGFFYDVNGGPEQDLAIAYDIPAEIGNVMLFRDVLEDMPTGVPINYRIELIDDVGNVSTPVSGSIGLIDNAYCFGDGSGTPCPCANVGNPGEGCANSSALGARLSSSGFPSSSNSTLSLDVSTAPATTVGLFFSGTVQVAGGNGVPFGDGLLCAGGAINRLGISVTDGSGSTSLTVLGALTRGPIAGQTLFYQYWFRDVTGPCGANFNTSNGVGITWGS